TCKAIGIIQRNPEFADVRSLEGLSPTRPAECRTATAARRPAPAPSGRRRRNPGIQWRRRRW
ncbi:hypothetical protein FK513_30525, partial [Klebsiella pneumoniae]|nr:hypothetical protein [Klebsiella pneumoniae]